MSELWGIRVTLSNGETKWLAGAGNANEVGDLIEKFQRGQVPYRGEWLETTDASIVARAQIVEATTAPLDDSRRPVG